MCSFPSEFRAVKETLSTSRTDLQEQSRRHCVHQLAKNAGTDFCQQQVKAARVVACLGESTCSYLVINSVRVTFVCSKEGADLHFKVLRKPAGQPGIFNQSILEKWNGYRSVCAQTVSSADDFLGLAAVQQTLKWLLDVSLA